MIDSAELQSTIVALRAPAKKASLFGRKRKAGGNDARLATARRFVELANAAPPEPALLEIFDRIVAEYPGEDWVRRGYGKALASAGSDPEAISEFEEALRIEPNDSEALTAVAELYERADRVDMAIDRLRRAVDACVAKLDLDAAVAAARRLITLEPQSLEHATDLVSILRAREPALLAEALEHLANVYRERGKLGQEAGACQELLALAGDRNDVGRRLAAIYTRILEVDPDDGDAWIGLATVDELLADQLRVLLSRESQAQPESPMPSASMNSHEAYATRKAQELMDAGDMLGASLCLERAIRTGGDPRSHLRLASCYQALHREPEAVREGLRSLALAQFAADGAMVDDALGWLAVIRPDAQDSLIDTLFLNHRPTSADTLYEEFMQSWDAIAADSVKAVRGPE